MLKWHILQVLRIPACVVVCVRSYAVAYQFTCVHACVPAFVRVHGCISIKACERLYSYVRMSVFKCMGVRGCVFMCMYVCGRATVASRSTSYENRCSACLRVSRFVLSYSDSELRTRKAGHPAFNIAGKPPIDSDGDDDDKETP